MRADNHAIYGANLCCLVMQVPYVPFAMAALRPQGRSLKCHDACQLLFGFVAVRNAKQISAMRQVFAASEFTVDLDPAVIAVTLNEYFLQCETQGGIVVAWNNQNVGRSGLCGMFDSPEDCG
jgi:hypothetical protein